MTEHALAWRASPAALALATCAAVALTAGVVGRWWELVVFAAPMLGALGAVTWLPRPATRVRVETPEGALRCFESESVRLSVQVRACGGAAELAVTPAASDSYTVEQDGDGEYLVSAHRWGRYEPALTVTARAGGGLWTATVRVPVAELRIFPLAPPMQTPLPHAPLPDRIGAHRTRRYGSGVEFGDIRPHAPGDPLRSVNWPVSARRGRLHVTERIMDRAADVVAVLDTTPQAPGPASESLHRTVRGATQVVQSALQRGDRAGVVASGLRLRWLGADIGRRQFYRILDTVLDSDSDSAASEGTLVPRVALPPRAVVIAFSTMLDTNFALALLELRRRGHVVVAVDVLRGPPFEHELDPMTARMWRLERRNMYRNMGVLGVPVVAWEDDSALDLALALADRARRPSGALR
ncbi:MULTISPECIES: DUF58 domain-containing protein [unclassified Rhodococcus (in: high G+C Gram-positive bacteria)]|uniref:DUF58 domain-containing protein n=1 Tax=unclassified Rhodococcus (in: high G+C Gram-positive bacteria) TaxID=192944 RepID=UPI00163A7429|nr:MULTISPECIES: DUF58 domain-containing protein [unclassified Rhodococcus (in: high G+C Gram-positive bacteria)]MBC2641792.1 DUF58 domain-containing protein [Rhodococcus sp. 3A]MBC2893463.1 DUF58 domain-containing protein [Rhodococcus sp. 4CII]